MSYSPYSEPSLTPESPQPSTLKTLLVVLAVIGALGLVMCGGLMGLMWYGIQQLEQEMARLDPGDLDQAEDWDRAYEDALADAIRDDPQVQQRIGEIEQVREDATRTSERTAPEDPYFWYEVQGTQGTAHVRAAISEEADRWFDSAALELPTGQMVPLTLGQVPYDTLLSRELYHQLRNAPQLTGEIGPLVRVEEDWKRTDDQTAPDDPYYWFGVVGERGQVAVVAERDENDETFVSAEMERPDGTRQPLQLE